MIRRPRPVRFVCTLVFAALVLFIGARPALSQVFTATVTGVVTDPSGGVVPNATVTITNTGNNETRTTTSSTNGSYTVSQLLPGSYELSAQVAGFKSSSSEA